MHLRRTAVTVTTVIVVVIAGMTFMGLFRRYEPSKDDPAAYTKAFVQKAIERYDNGTADSAPGRTAVAVCPRILGSSG